MFAGVATKLSLCFCLSAYVRSASVPSYIKPCSLSDPGFEQCAISTATAFFKQIGQGDPSFQIPALASVKFPFATVHNGNDIYINITNVSLLGFDKIAFKSIKKDPDHNKIYVEIAIPHFNIGGDYDVVAKIDKKSVSGKGNGDWIIDNLYYNLSFQWNIIERDGVKYADIIDKNFDIKFEKGALKIDVEQGNDVNDVLTENMQQLVREVWPRCNFYLKKVFDRLTKNLFSAVPYDELFLK